VGLGWVMAGLNVFLRDTAQFVTVALTFWFWLTPIMIPEQRAPHYPLVHWLLAVNPMTYAVRVYRSALLPNHWAAPADVVILAACGGAVFVAGGLFFRYLKRGFADVL